MNTKNLEAVDMTAEAEKENVLVIELEDAERIVNEEIKASANKSAFNPSFYLIDARAVDRICAELKRHCFFSKPWGIPMRRAE